MSNGVRPQAGHAFDPCGTKRYGFLLFNDPPATRGDDGAVREGAHTNVPGRARGRGGGWGLQGGSLARHTFFMMVRRYRIL